MILHRGILLLLLLVPALVASYSIDEASCNDIQANRELSAKDIDSSVQEALNIAEYAAFRMLPENGVPPGRIVEQLLGKDSSQKFIDTMKLLPRTGELSDSTKGSINIVCGTRYLKTTGNSFIDTRWEDMCPILLAPDAGEPCEGTEIAFGFPVEASTNPNAPSWVTVLCDGVESSLADDPTINSASWNADWEDAADFRGDIKAIEVSAESISRTLLHELLHFVEPTLTEKLSNGDPEVYVFKQIQELSDEAKLSNTESYVFLATSLYIIPYEVDADGSFTRFDPDKRPKTGPHFAAPPPSPLNE